ncbi:hypothetical protein JA116_08140 [Morganella morganii]|uniref:hypothetical protein n=1 Tax=Morganella morganii TaxID=582 RepID=UPI000D1D9258|nr:hypothetical protein [Morganella morganii]QXO44175.1 hypothetical protein CXB74_008245 [Morganella morganii]QXO47766.1 hypothetical protein JC862_08100 [Morganella morganii]QXO51557.1 hypothetical protein JC861_08200 [Morganella morganii]QXO55421.1 hypothetical protein JC830_08200 [Morganella morganii]QXO82019.1 hypothetical protein JA116_08140 [Morganella morganii]
MTEEYEHASIRVEMASDATIRDYFAARAMQGILSNNSMIDTATESTFEWVTRNAYQLADAMLRAREK